jgi:hypothetical protein
MPQENDERVDPVEHLSRPYRHLKCGTVTLVSGIHYVMLENPFRSVSATYCVGCQNFFALKSVVWDDTGENIGTYRNRVYYSVPWKRRFSLSWFGTVYEGSLNLHLDKNGRPLPPDETKN